MRIILLGPPGSGKGTQGGLIEKKYGFPRISTGDLFRRAVKKRTPLGKKVESVMNRGELVSDDIVIEVVRERIEMRDCKKGYVLDGFPRNIAQVHALKKIKPEQSEMILDIVLDDEAVIERLSARRVCSACGKPYNLLLGNSKEKDECDLCKGKLVSREDDRPDIIKERLRVYHEETEPLVDFYQREGIYHEVDGNGPVSQVFESISGILDKQLKQVSEITEALS
ncbi:MAG: adenylate kinase [Candidatus Aminicenantes bacterium]|nr:adenylate kinase [Candidatus Aminicenantes bacterium]